MSALSHLELSGVKADLFKGYILMPLIYDKKKRKVVDTISGRSLEFKRGHYQSSTFDYIFQDGDKNYKVGAYVSYYTVDPKIRNSPLKKVITYVDGWGQIDDNGMRQEGAVLQRYLDYEKYKADIERMLVALGTEGVRPEDLEYDEIVDFSKLDKYYKSEGVKK